MEIHLVFLQIAFNLSKYFRAVNYSTMIHFSCIYVTFVDIVRCDVLFITEKRKHIVGYHCAIKTSQLPANDDNPEELLPSWVCQTILTHDPTLLTVHRLSRQTSLTLLEWQFVNWGRKCWGQLVVAYFTSKQTAQKLINFTPPTPLVPWLIFMALCWFIKLNFGWLEFIIA